MNFGILTEGYLTGGTASFRERYHEVLAEAKLADQAGFDVFGTSEQHFTAPRFTISAGELFLAAVAVLTERIHLRTSTTLLPFHQPVRVAEQIATLDNLSGGRVEFGSGKGNSTYTAGGFNVDLAERDRRWEEGMELVIRAWTQDEFSFDGKYYQVPSRRLSPTLVQKPHPPLWYAAISPASHELAGRKGLGVMSLTIAVTLSQLEKRIKTYRDAIRHAEPYAGIVNNSVSVFCLAHCAESNEQARSDAEAPMLNYLKEAVDLYETTLKAAGTNVDFSKIRATISDFALCVETGMALVGDPDTLAQKLKQYESMGVDEVMIRMDGISHPANLKSIELFGKHVIPRFKNRGAA